MTYTQDNLQKQTIRDYLNIKQTLVIRRLRTRIKRKVKEKEKEVEKTEPRPRSLGKQITEFTGL